MSRRDGQPKRWQIHLRCYRAWCAQHDLQPLQAQRGQLELYLRDLHTKGCARRPSAGASQPSQGSFGTPSSTRSSRRNPALAVTRPKLQWEGQRRTVLHPLEFAAVLTAARRHSDTGFGAQQAEASNVTTIRFLALRARTTRRHRLAPAHPVGSPPPKRRERLPVTGHRQRRRLHAIRIARRRPQCLPKLLI